MLFFDGVKALISQARTVCFTSVEIADKNKFVVVFSSQSLQVRTRQIPLKRPVSLKDGKMKSGEVVEYLS